MVERNRGTCRRQRPTRAARPCGRPQRRPLETLLPCTSEFAGPRAGELRGTRQRDAYSASTSTTTTPSLSTLPSAIRQWVDPWNLGPLLVRELLVCHVSADFTTATPGARRPDGQLRRPRSSHQRSQMNIENRQVSLSFFTTRSPGSRTQTAPTRHQTASKRACPWYLAGTWTNTDRQPALRRRKLLRSSHRRPRVTRTHLADDSAVPSARHEPGIPRLHERRRGAGLDRRMDRSGRRDCFRRRSSLGTAGLRIGMTSPRSRASESYGAIVGTR